MTNIYILEQKINMLEKQKKKFNELSNMSIIQFIQQKQITKQQKKLHKKIQEINYKQNKANFIYESKTKSWLINQKINCRKYYKLEQKALYQKDLELYKLGIINKKPVHPFINNIQKITSPIFNNLVNYSKNLKSKITNTPFLKKYYKFKNTIFPYKINELAVNTAIIGIKGYKNFQNNLNFIKKFFNNKSSVKYIHNVIQQANQKINQEINPETNPKINHKFNQETISKPSFRNSLKITDFKSPNDSKNNKKHILNNSNFNNFSFKKNSSDYELDI